MRELELEIEVEGVTFTVTGEWCPEFDETGDEPAGGGFDTGIKITIGGQDVEGILTDIVYNEILAKAEEEARYAL